MLQVEVVINTRTAMQRYAFSLDEYLLVRMQKIVRLRQYTSSADFRPEAVGQVSAASKSLCQWVLAVEQFATAYHVTNNHLSCNFFI